MHVFIDTNILLNFFHFTKEEVDALSNVFASHEHGSATVHLTEQVCNEFRRNRETKIKEALKRFNEVKFVAQLPAFMKQYEEYEKIVEKSKELQELTKSVAKKVDVDIVDLNLLTDTLIKEIFGKNTPIELTDDIFAAASKRLALGNPPGKNKSLGDAVNWETLLSVVPAKENLHIVSEDGDFYSSLDENRPHPYLTFEWAEKKSASVFVYRTLSSFLSEHFDGVAFSYDKDKDALIDKLAESGSFAQSHNLVAELEKFGYFSLKEVQRILSAALSNSQFGWIATDGDIYAFLKRVAVPRMGSLPEEQAAFIKETLEKFAAITDL